MRRFPRALAVLLAILMVASPAASAVPTYPKVIDDHIGDVNERLKKANSTYGEREEFQRATASLSRASLSLLNNASVVSHSSLTKAVGGLETGRARAQAGGSGGGSQQVVDHGRQLASQAESQLRQVRSSLESMEKTGLEPVAFSGGLTAAYAANRALDLLRQYEQAINQWERGTENERLEAAIVSTGAGARLNSQMAADILEETTQARANSTASNLVSAEELDELVQDRVGWVQANAAPAAKQSRERVTSMNENNESLMTLSAFTLYFQDVAFNGLRQQMQRGQDVEPFRIARDLYERGKRSVQAWVNLLDIPGGFPLGAMESANLTLVLNQNATGKVRNESGAFAVGLAHLGIEHTGLLQQAYGDKEHDPGTELQAASLSSGEAESGLLPVPGPGVVAALLALAFVALRRRRGKR